MGFVEFDCLNFGSLKIIGDSLHSGHDFFVKSNAEGNEVIDYLIFLDSRGISRQFEQSLADKLISRIDRMQKTYLLICRPVELTIWATLIGFLAYNRVIPKKIITNMGFVDFTPKKRSILLNAIVQVESILGKGIAKSNFVENFFLSEGDLAPLYSMNYDNAYRVAIEKIAANYPMLIINTPLTEDHIAIERRRPPSFFLAQAKANDFNESIKGALVVDFPNFDETMTYDAVHYTLLGNAIIYNRVKNYL
jgi:hypothetical protein